MNRKGTSFQRNSRDTQRERRHQVLDGGSVLYLSEAVMAAVHQLRCFLYGPVDIGGSPMFPLSL